LVILQKKIQMEMFKGKHFEYYAYKVQNIKL
jgi:hypothetical protein